MRSGKEAAKRCGSGTPRRSCPSSPKNLSRRRCAGSWKKTRGWSSGGPHAWGASRRSRAASGRACLVPVRKRQPVGCSTTCPKAGRRYGHRPAARPRRADPHHPPTAGRRCPAARLRPDLVRIPTPGTPLRRPRRTLEKGRLPPGVRRPSKRSLTNTVRSLPTRI